jgi:hypothetical protein
MSRKRKADEVVDSVRADASDDSVLDDMNGRRIAKNLPETDDDAYDDNYVDNESCPDGDPQELVAPPAPPSPPLAPPSDLSGNSSSSQMLRRLTERSNALVASRRRTLCLTSQRVRAAKRSYSRADAADEVVPVKQRWRLYISTLDPLFFHESTLEEDGGRSTIGIHTGGRGLSSAEPGLASLRSLSHNAQKNYAALRINEENNEDVAELFRKKWASKALRGQPLNSYAQLRACTGQFCRFCITLRLVEAEAVCDRGTLFHLVCEVDLVRGFVAFWQARATCSTVYSKVCQLKVLLHEAWTYFGLTSDEARRHKTREVNEFILSVAAAEKTETRRLSSGRRDVDVRATEGKLFLPKDFEFCINQATNELLLFRQPYLRV